MSNYVPGWGNPEAKLMVVGEAPGKHEDERLEPFVGPTGEMVDQFLLEAGMPRHQCYLTNVYKYKPLDSFKKKNDISTIGKVLQEVGTTEKAQIDQLWDEIRAINPNCILALGNTPLEALSGKRGIKKWRGSILKSSVGPKLVATIHPAALLHMEDSEGVFTYSAKTYIQFDFARAVEQAAFPEIRIQERRVEIARSATDLWRFLDLYRACKRVTADIEAVKCIPVCIGLAFNDWHAISIPLLDLFSWQGRPPIPTHELAQMWLLVDQLLSNPEIQVVGQNFKYDQQKLEKPCGFTIANLYSDTSLKAHTLFPELPVNLAFLTSIHTEQPYYKDEGREFNLQKDKVERLYTYNGFDACVDFGIDDELEEIGNSIEVPGFPNWFQEFFYGYVMKLHKLYMDMEEEGLDVDFEYRRKLIREYRFKVEEKEEELWKLVGWKINSNSPKQIGALLYDELRIPRRQGVDEDVLVAILGNVLKKESDPRRKIIELILELRRLKKALGTYFMAPPDYDGKMRWSIRIAGTETGRSTNQILKPPIRPHKLGIAFQTMTKHGDIGSELRRIFIAEPGHYFVNVDLSQAEARIVALLGRSNETLELFGKTDIHRLTSSWIFGIPIETVTKELRFIGKTCRHAGNYDMGKKRLMQLVNSDAKKFHIDINLSEWKAGQILDKFHSFSPWIRNTFHEEVRQALVENSCILVNPYGRRREFLDRWGEDLWKEAYSHLPQSTVADHVKKAMLRIKERIPTVRFTGESHDAFLAKVPEKELNYQLAIFKEEMERPIDFTHCTMSRGIIVIPCEAEVGRNYKDYDESNPDGLRKYTFQTTQTIA